MNKKVLLSAVMLSLGAGALAQTAEGSIDYFRKPAVEIETITMAAPLPAATYNAGYTKIALAYTDSRSVPINELAPNEVRIGGLRINTENFSINREAMYERIQVVDVKTGSAVYVDGIPQGAKIRHITWSPAGDWFCFTNTTETSVDLYRVDCSQARPAARKISSDRVNAVLGTPFVFLSNSEVLYRTVPSANRQTPKMTAVYSNVIQENLGTRKSGLRTYEDLMVGPFDEKMYDYLATSELVLYNGQSTRKVADAAIYRSLDPSPDGRYIIAETEHHPYSYVETHRSFPSRQFIMDLDGKVVKMLNDGTKKDEPKKDAKDDDKDKKPAAPKPSGFAWRADLPAVLTWTESNTPAPSAPAAAPADADKDKKKEKEPEKTHTSKLYQTGAPFNFESEKTLVLDPEYRMGRVTWGNDGIAVYTETSTDKKMRMTIAFKPCDTLAAKTVLFEESTELDSLGNFPVYGSVFTVKNQYGKSVLWTDAKNSQLLLSGSRRDAEGWPHAFLDRLTVKDRKAETVWKEEGEMKHTLIGVTDFGKNMKILQTKEAFGVVPDYYETDLKKGTDRQVTSIRNSVPQLTDLITKQIVEYTRKDGLKCYGSLYLPKNYDKLRDGRLPVLMWTYPYEYKLPIQAEQERPDRYKYLKPTYGSAQIWATQGYAVLDEFTMAIVAEHRDSLENNVFLEQLIMSAESAVDFIVDSLGIGDRDRIAVGGHSYGGFMTANLLAHTKLFRAGIARSGAYLRSLTPFGFQSERRNYWNAKDVYDRMSPFNYADKLKDAILIIHGMQDDNMGTFPVQSERLYQAVIYNGGTARYVQMPLEAHSYYGKETTLDMLYETGAWLDKYVKKAEPRKEEKKPEKKAE